MQFKSFFLFSALVVSAVASPTELVQYGSGTAHVEKRTDVEKRIGGCSIEPGAVCGGLATACAGAIVDSDAAIIWQFTICAVAGLWCGGQAILNILCCFEKIPSCKNGNQYTGAKEVDIQQREINEIATYADNFGTSFTNADLLHFIQGNGGADSEILGHPDRVNQINKIMKKLTGSPTGMATRAEVQRFLEDSVEETGFNI